MNRRDVLRTLGSSALALVSLSHKLNAAAEPAEETLRRVLPSFNSKSRSLLQKLLQAGFTGQIPAAAVKELLSSEGTDIGTLMVRLLPLARTYSRPPISNYYVGAVVKGASGSIYPGANLEIPGHSLGFSVHGEQAAISNAYMHGESAVISISVTAAPCGHCRQFMKEVSPDSGIEILVEGKAPAKLSSLLPLAFGPKDLGFKEGAFPVRQTKLILPNTTDAVTAAALDAARHSYAPYSESPSGVAIMTKGGGMYKGSYLENAAFNPSLSPLQIGLVQLILAGEDFFAISQVVLVESSRGKISQASVTQTVLNAIAPAVSLQRFQATPA